MEDRHVQHLYVKELGDRVRGEVLAARILQDRVDPDFPKHV